MAVTKQELEVENEQLKAQLAAAEGASAPTAPAGPHVLTAVHSVLGKLGVKKGGQLPANMGGKPYISAADLNYGVKELFVENNLIIVPREEMLRYEIIDVKDRKQTYMLIHGHYQIVSTVDGSNVEISGLGDGIATGSAVTSNIASTNALKNALLRTFLVTEQSTEDAAKNGPAEGEASAPGDRAQQAAQAQRPAAPPQAPPTDPPEKAAIRKDFIDSNLFTKEQVNSVMEKVKGLEEFRGADKLYPEVYRRLATGEVPE